MSWRTIAAMCAIGYFVMLQIPGRMRPMRHLLALALLLVLPVAGCGDNRSVDQPIDAAADPDANIDAGPSIDASCPVRGAGQVGGTCAIDTDCNSAAGVDDGYCLIGNQGNLVWPSAGYCVNQIDTCTANSCGAGNQCTTINDPLGAFRACLPACGTGACACSDGQLCANSFVGSAFGAGQTACMPGNAAATDGSTCTQFAECAQDSLCQFDPAEFPSGQCARIGCVVGNDTTCAANGDGHCVNFAPLTSGFNTGTVCVDSCDADTDCRQAEGYKCFDGGGTTGKYCRHPQVGDVCAVDTDCGDVAVWRCSGALPGGACTLRAVCPTPGAATGCTLFSSICWDGVTAGTPNMCVDRCGGPENLPGGCRTGLTCRDVDPGGGPSRVFLGCVAP